MLETSTYEYVAFGHNYFILSNSSAGHPARGRYSIAWVLDDFLKRLDKLNLQVTSRAASDLREIRERLDAMPDDAIVDADLARDISKACRSVNWEERCKGFWLPLGNC